ncbi:neuromedin-U receptor 1-like [Glandiceps talaboti]
MNVSTTDAFIVNMQTSQNLTDTFGENVTVVDGFGIPAKNTPVGQSEDLCLLTDEVYYIGATVIASLGLICNTIFIYVICRTPSMRTLANAYLVNLAVADMLLLLSLLPYYAFRLGEMGTLLGSKAYVCYMAIFHNILLFTSLITVTIISTERYIGICYPLRWRNILTKGRVRALISFTWVFGVVFSIPRILQCVLTDPDLRTKMTITSVLLFVIVFPVAIVTISVMYLLTARSFSKFVKVMKVQGVCRKSDEKQMSITCGVISVVFFICLLPSVYKFIHQSIWIITGKQIGGIFATCMYDFARWLLVINSSVNPLLYNVLSKSGRNAFIQAITCQKTKPSQTSGSAANTRKITMTTSAPIKTYV